MEFILLIIGFIVAYLIGSFSSAVWIGRIFYHKDVRDYGSHNAGTTNTIRVLGLKPGIVVLALDTFKGWLAVSLDFLFLCPATEAYAVYFDVALALAVVLGHVFPLYTGFKGGKGVASAFGFILVTNWHLGLLAFGVWLIMAFLFRYSSLAALTAAVSVPVFSFFLVEPVYAIFYSFIAVLVIIRHHANIRRLLKGEESKITFKKK